MAIGVSDKFLVEVPQSLDEVIAGVRLLPRADCLQCKTVTCGISSYQHTTALSALSGLLYNLGAKGHHTTAAPA